jgi:hypothetical protein
MIDLDAFEKRCEKATEGPWEWERVPYRRELFDDCCVEGVEKQLKVAGDDGIEGWIINPLGEDGVGGKEEDEDFIAHARQDIPDLLTLVREQQKRLEELEKQLAQEEREENHPKIR